MDISQEVTLIVIASTFFLVVAIGIIILILVYQKKQLRFINEKQALQSQFQEEILMSRIEVQEETLNNVSKEIHDNIGQLVGSAKILVGVAERKFPDVGDSLHQADQSLSKAIHELRLLSKSLNSEWLKQFNFYENLENEVIRINSSGEIAMSIGHREELHLSKEAQLILFRTVQEAFQNSLKHGNPSLININVEQKESMLMVTIEDNGTGFKTQDPPKQGFGITSMKHRVKLLSGTIHWRADHNGTTVTIEIPHGNEN